MTTDFRLGDLDPHPAGDLDTLPPRGIRRCAGAGSPPHDGDGSKETEPMTNAMSVKLAPVGESPMPTTRITNAAQPIPVISWESEDGWQTVEIVLGNHPDPGRYLRDLARQLTAFAHEVDAARDQRQPRGYCCPTCVVSADGHGDAWAIAASRRLP